MAKRRRSTRRRTAAPVRRRRRTSARRRSNPRVIYRTRAVRRRRRRANPGTPVRRRRTSARRRNPVAFGSKVTSGRFMTALLGGLVGVAATKFIPTLIPAGLIQGGNVMRFIVSAASAVAAGMLAQKFAGSSGFGDGVMFGGLMQAASVGMNAFLPPSAGFLALNGGRGMGVFQDSRFTIPENPIRGYVAPAPAGARVNMSGIQRAFATAF